MQRYGNRLDKRTNGQWVCDALVRHQHEFVDGGPIVVDAVRILKQVEAIRKAFGDRAYHIHLEAPVNVLAGRYAKRSSPGFVELASYDEVGKDSTERRIEELSHSADVVIDTSRCTPDDVLIRAASHLGLYSREYDQLVDVLVGGQYGSEGKGHIASYLAREYDVLVRVGGPNAGHRVYEEAEAFTHHQLPSGTRRTEAAIVIGPGAVLDPKALLEEIAACHVTAERLSIDSQAMIINQDDRDREEALVKGIGSTGQGVGAATARKIMGRAGNATSLARDVRDLRPFIRDTNAVLEQAYRDGKKVFLEGTQGAGLSLHHGSYPHVTSRDTSVSGCLAEAGIAPRRVRRIIMVCRTYPIRVQSPEGATSGGMAIELTWEEIENRAGLPLGTLQPREFTSTTHKPRRVAEFDWQLLKKAATVNGPTDIALTFADYLSKDNLEARRFEQLTAPTVRFVEEIERIASAPVSLISTRFHTRSIIDRRRW
jgi:adenylosuccinate synthase